MCVLHCYLFCAWRKTGGGNRRRKVKRLLLISLVVSPEPRSKEELAFFFCAHTAHGTRGGIGIVRTHIYILYTFLDISSAKCWLHEVARVSRENRWPCTGHAFVDARSSTWTLRRNRPIREIFVCYCPD